MAGGDRSGDGARRAALALAGVIAGELEAAGADAVVLMGSYARGDARAHSDLDIIALGEGFAYGLEIRDDLLVAVCWLRPAEIEAAFMSPGKAGYQVGGWRDAVVLRDRRGVAAPIIERARRWSWEDLGPSSPDRYVAGEIYGLAEEVHKLVNLIGEGNLSGAALQRNLLATRLGAIIAVHLRLIYSTENTLWDLVAEQMGPDWAVAQGRALGLDDEDFRTTCAAALELYRLAAGAVRFLFEQRELAVVERAVAVARTLEAGA